MADAAVVNASSSAWPLRDSMSTLSSPLACSHVASPQCFTTSPFLSWIMRFKMSTLKRSPLQLIVELLLMRTLSSMKDKHGIENPRSSMMWHTVSSNVCQLCQA